MKRSQLASVAFSLLFLSSCPADAPQPQPQPWESSPCYSQTTKRTIDTTTKGICTFDQGPLLAGDHSTLATVHSQDHVKHELRLELDKPFSSGSTHANYYGACFGEALQIMNLEGARVKMTQKSVWPSTGGHDADAIYAVTVRTPEGQLLWAHYDDGFEPEKLKEVIPEITLTTGAKTGEIDYRCPTEGPDKKETYEVHNLELSTAVSAVSGKMVDKRRLGIGCVDYLVVVGHAHKRKTNNCFRARSRRSYFIIRESLVRFADPG